MGEASPLPTLLEHNMTRIFEAKDGLAVDTPFDRGFLNALKDAIPSHERRWSPKGKDPSACWVVHPKYADVLVQLIQIHYSQRVTAPNVTVLDKVHRGKIHLRYVGASKMRDDGSHIAYGMSHKTENWSTIIPLHVLENWFEGKPLPDIPDEPATLLPPDSPYRILQFKKKTDDMDEIKAAFRRMSRQWHPDVCKEPNANDMFISIKDAYEFLSDPDKKEDYDIALNWEMKSVKGKLDHVKMKHSHGFDANDQYHPALRCGILDCEYTLLVGRNFISKIHTWDDIVDSQGRTMVSTWVWPDDKPTVIWV